MIICVSGLHGTGKSTIARHLAKALDLKHYSTGDIFRTLADERNMDLEEFSAYAEDNKEIDLELDAKIQALAESGDNYIFDAQLCAYLLGELADYCILLKCAQDVRIERMMARDNKDKEKMVAETMAREQSERQRFIDLYKIDILDGNLILGTYDLILDVTHIGIDQVTAIAETAIRTALK